MSHLKGISVSSKIAFTNLSWALIDIVLQLGYYCSFRSPIKGSGYIRTNFYHEYTMMITLQTSCASINLVYCSQSALGNPPTGRFCSSFFVPHTQKLTKRFIFRHQKPVRMIQFMRTELMPLIGKRRTSTHHTPLHTRLYRCNNPWLIYFRYRYWKTGYAILISLIPQHSPTAYLPVLTLTATR